jgi:hypothetical protein
MLCMAGGGRCPEMLCRAGGGPLPKKGQAHSLIIQPTDVGAGHSGDLAAFGCLTTVGIQSGQPPLFSFAVFLRHIPFPWSTLPLLSSLYSPYSMIRLTKDKMRPLR